MTLQGHLNSRDQKSNNFCFAFSSFMYLLSKISSLTQSVTSKVVAFCFLIIHFYITHILFSIQLLNLHHIYSEAQAQVDIVL